jgi:hypothetical protein
MANTLLTIAMITREALRVLVNNLVFTKQINQEYDDQFGKTGAKIGNVLNIRKPPRFVRTDGQGLQLQDVTETSVPLVLTTQAQRAFTFSSSDFALSIDDFSERYIKPAVASMANQVDFDGLGLAAQVAQAVGTPGTVPNQLLTYLQAQQKLNESAAPDDDDRAIVMNPAMQATIIDSLKGLFQSSERISEQYKRGKMGETIGANWYMDQNVRSQTIGAQGGTPLVNAANQTGLSITTSGWTASITVLGVGDIVTFAGVNAVNPQSFQDTGSLKQFVITAPVVSNGSGVATLNISPALTTSGPFQTVTVSPANNAVVTVFGAGGVVSPQGLCFHRDFATMACADLPLWGGVDMAERVSDKELGLSIRLIRAYDINQDRCPTRLDFLYGWAVLYQELACRIAS